MRAGVELAILERAGRDDRVYRDRPNVCLAVRVVGRVVDRGGARFAGPDDRVALLADPPDGGAWRGRTVVATVVEQVGDRAVAYDVTEAP